MPLTAEQTVDDLANAIAGLGMELTDVEILAEAVEELGSVKAVEAEMQRLAGVILRAFPVKH
ncbi:MAG TPA: hypothetical protein ENH55_08355 [Aurantimonas coralicida]|uniref:Uncharacterized protein n=2 Tax=root TaxID=1 RepID=A0A9C9NDS1_9HYPH|nr:hypothetical protein [Aurantimonas coralicida]HET99458.1 hypothetical protein [Aurantimonas coralicida]